MSTERLSWEAPLLSQAYQGLAHVWPRVCHPLDVFALARAYQHCDTVTRRHSRTFYLASGLLPPEKRRAMRALYAFCRISDDLVDQGAGRAPSEAQEALAAWRKRALHDCPPAHDLDVLAWADAQRCYSIPLAYAEQLLDGLARDLVQTRYATFHDLAAYCYSVASTVGLMAMHIVGFEGPEAIPYAVKLGVALQLTNILRDVGEDWARGRLYLAKDELAAFGLSEADIAAGRVDARWQAFMRFQIARVRRLYTESLPGVRLLHPDGRLAIGAAAELYCAILGDIEAHGMDVFRRRAYLGAWPKLRRLPGIWWRARVVGYAAARPPTRCPVLRLWRYMR